ncbi:MAG TPA: POTRA domain-containing protein [Candidatus Acidoferrales bacterium]|nr:POTRA domain-containing protein [Candidatus Acidoferrales bacterium]
MALRTISLFAILAVTVFFTAAQQQAPQTETGSSPLAAIEIIGSQRYSSDQIAPATGLHVGTGVGRDDLQQAANRLARLGCFASVQYRFTSVGPGVKVTFEVTDAPEIPALFDNIPWVSREELIGALKNSVPLFDGNAPEQGALLDDIALATEKILDSHNVRVHVTHIVSNSGATNQKVQRFSTEGTDMIIGAVEFPDMLAKTDRGLQDRVIDLIGQPYSLSSIEIFNLEQVRPVYLAHGFLQVKFGQPSVDFASAGKTPAAAPSTKVTVTVPIEPGPAYNWNGITWKGNYSVPSENLDQLVNLQTGDLADGMKIQAGIEAARTLYGEKGYLDAKIDAQPHFDDANKRVSYAVTIDEGPQYHMGSLILTGLSLDGEKRIRNAWKIAPGEVFDKNIYENFVDLGIKQAFAGSPLRYDKIGRFLQENSKDAKVDVMLDFQ